MNNKENVLLYPIIFLWIIVLLPKTIQLGIYCSFVFFLIFSKRIQIKSDSFITFQILYLIVFGVSILINCIITFHETTRIMAAINTFSINACALIIYGIYKEKSRTIDFNKLEKACLVNSIALIVLFVLFRIGIQFPTLHGKSISGADWLSGSFTPRFLGYMDYANAVVLFILLIYPFAILHIKRFSFQIIFSILLLFTVIGANSRTGLVLFSLLVLIECVSGKNDNQFHKIKKYQSILLVLLCSILFFLSMFFISNIKNVIDTLINARIDSNGMRTFIYHESLSIMIKDSPIIGKGVKDLIYPYDYPYGSHSTYIGQLYKSGFLGSIFYFFSLLSIIKSIIGRKVNTKYDLLKKASIIFVLFYMIFEDIDGTNWGICLFYMMLGINANTSYNMEEKNGK